MELRLTLIDPQRAGRCVDVAVRTPAGTALSAVADQLAAAVGLTTGQQPTTEAGLQFSCEGGRIASSAILGLPPLLQGAVLALRPARPSDQRGSEPIAAEERLIEAHVVAGPDAGTVLPLTAGRHAIGRSSSNSLQIVDPQISREHAELLVEGQRLTLRDRGSTGGTWLSDQPVAERGGLIGVDQEFRLGASRVAVRGPDRPPAALTLDGEGHIRINRSPQLRPARSAQEIHFPAAPAERAAIRFPWPAMLLPLILALVMAALWRQPGFAMFALITPVMVIGQQISERRSATRVGRRGSARQRAAEQRSQAALDLAVAQDVAFLDQERPDLARLAVTARIPTDELWRRSSEQPSFLLLRLGRGSEASTVLVHRPDGEQPTGRAGQAFVHPDVPIAVDLGEIGILGVSGSRPAVLAMARSLIGQLCVLHSPDQVQLEVVVAEELHRRDWHWVYRLPHHCSPTNGERMPSEAATASRRLPGTAASDAPQPCRVIVLDGAHALARRPDMALALAEAGVESGSSGPHRPMLICLDQTEQDLPAQCRSTVILPGATPALLRRAQASTVQFTPDLAGVRWAERLSRQLAPYRQAGSDRAAALPTSVRLIDVLACDDVAADDRVRPTEPADLARHWRRDGGGSRPSAILGRSVDAVYRIDLRRDGPHLLIGGTTGAGKSELLQTLVASLAIDSAPDQVSFLLIDYKGGAAFRECAALPHVAGIITDLDQHLARRALASLTAELRRRERRLNAARVADIDAYSAVRRQRAAASNPPAVLPAMPRLVVVVDEFRVLAEELPEFVSGLIRIATVGRSLGVHLVLATQRPAGIVSAEISANVNLRIALRVRDRADSLDLIDHQAAALIPADCPGRAWARSGGGPLLSFQTARVSGRPSMAVDDQPQVVRLNPDGLPSAQYVESPPTPAAGPDLSPELSPDLSPDPSCADVSDLSVIAYAAREAAALLQVEPVRSPWLPALPEMLALEKVLSIEDTEVVGPVADRAHPHGLPERSESHLRLPYGIADLPQEQRQQVAAWQLGQQGPQGGSNLAVAGGPRSGRTTTLITLAHAAALSSTSRPLHVYAVDGSGGLARLRGLAYLDAVVPVHDVERSQRLLGRISAEVGDRQRSATSAAMIGDVILIVDGWEATTSAWNEVDHGRMVDQLICLLRDGPAVGVFTAVSGGRALLTGNVSSLLGERLVLRFADATDALLAGVPAAQLSGQQPAGRGILLSSERPAGVEVQVALAAGLHGDSRGSVTERSVDADRSERAGWRVSALPSRLDYRQLLAARPARPLSMGSADVVPIGIGGDDAGVLGLDLAESPVSLLVGPPGSGRTSTLRCIAAGLVKVDRPVIAVSMTDREWPGEGAGALLVIDGRRPDAAERLSRALSECPLTTVLVDDLRSGRVRTARSDDPAELLGEALAAHSGGLVVAAQAPDVLAAYRGVLTVARTARAGLLLGAVGPGDGEALGVRLGRQPPGPPGRALLVRAGKVSTLQLALPPSHGEEPPSHRVEEGIAPMGSR